MHMKTLNNVCRPVALTTGERRDIGLAVVLALAKQGWDVCFSYAANLSAAREMANRAQSFTQEVANVAAFFCNYRSSHVHGHWSKFRVDDESMIFVNR